MPNEITDAAARSAKATKSLCAASEGELILVEN